MLRSGLVLLAMYLVYKWAMAKENMHAFNRGVLISIYIVALLAPLLPAASRLMSLFAPHHTPINIIADMDIPLPIVTFPETAAPVWPMVVTAIYLAGVMAMSAVTIASYIRLAQIVRSGEKRTLDSGAVLVITDRSGMTPFSWKKYVVVNREDYHECGDMILTHEQQHLRHNHWADMLLAQLVIIAQWFNPAAWLMREELRTVNEYQADAAVLQSGADARQYQLLLIKKAVGKSFPALANSLNHSKLKKRITMMLKSSSSKSRRVLALALVPAAVAAVAVFNIPAVASALSTVSNASIASLSHKVTTSEAYSSNLAEEISTPAPDLATVEKTTTGTINAVSLATFADTTVPAESKTTAEAPSEPSAKESPKFIFKVDGKEILPDANGEYEYKGMRFSVDKLNLLKSQYVESMSIDKSSNAVTVNLLGDNEKTDKGVARLPQFPGGDSALMQHIAKNIKYPQGAPTDGKTYRVVVSFAISATGKVGDAEIIRSQGELFDAEALKVINALPDFEPAVNEQGEKVACSYTLPISFKTMGEAE